MKWKDIEYYINCLVFIIIIIIAGLITNQLKEQYPSLIIDYDSILANQIDSYETGQYSLENNSFLREHTYIKGDISCIGDVMTLYPDETRINEGDLMIVKTSFKVDKGLMSYSVGMRPNELVNVIPNPKGTTVGFVYYKKGKNILYIEECSNFSYSSEVSFTPYFQIERPSFVDSKLGFLTILFGSILLLVEMYKIIMYFTFGKKIF
ncbi:MAG: hypothetical protein WC755_08700 [Candidatus Woesearchaeota archaeon]|jgi:hypothetical protein